MSGRYALIVAVSKYDDPKLRELRAPAIDAQRLAAVLKDPDIGGFEVDTALDDDERSLRRRLSRFLRDRRPDDLFLVHFSCHGIKDDDGELYLAAKDTEVGDLSATGISSEWLSRRIGRSRSRRAVVLLDCCFSGSFPSGLRARAGEEVNVKEHLEGRGRAVITASNALEYSYEGDELSGEGQPSIFTAAIIEGLESGKADRDGDRWISIDELYDYVYDRVKEQTPSQNPNKMSTLEGSLHIARSVYEPPVEPAELDSELVALIEHSYASARLGAVDELTRLLKSSNKRVVLAAQLALERMLDDDSRGVAAKVRDTLAEFAGDNEPASVSPSPTSDVRGGTDVRHTVTVSARPVDRAPEAPAEAAYKLADAPYREHRYDVVLAYNSRDAEAGRRARAIEEELQAHGKRAWLDTQDAEMGQPLLQSHLAAISSSECCMVLLGPHGLGTQGEHYELVTALEASVRQEGAFRICGVLLPGAVAQPPAELEPYLLLDLSAQFTDDGITAEGLERLLAAVEGVSLLEFRHHRDRSLQLDSGSGGSVSLGPRGQLPRADLDSVIAWAAQGRSAAWIAKKLDVGVTEVERLLDEEGSSFHQTSLIGSEQSAGRDGLEKRCPRCDNLVKRDDARYCPNCAYRLETSENPRPQRPDAPTGLSGF